MDTFAQDSLINLLKFLSTTSYPIIDMDTKNSYNLSSSIDTLGSGRSLGCSGTWESSLNMNTHGSKGQASLPRRMNSCTSALYHRNGASMRPYAPLFRAAYFMILHVQCLSEFGYRIYCNQSSCLRLALQESCLDIKGFHCPAMSGQESVTTSYGMFCSWWGSLLGYFRYWGPYILETTILAFALWVPLGRPFDTSAYWSDLCGFQVKIHRHLKI